jgi:polyphenol oxidase
MTYLKDVSYEGVKASFSGNTFIKPKLIHGTDVEYVTSGCVLTADGVFTQNKEIALVIDHADCQAAIFYDPIQSVVGLVHSGWRGNVLNIYAHMVEKMHRVCGSQAQDMHVYISPSLGPEHAEFVNYRDEFPEEMWRYMDSAQRMDLWQLSEHQLLEAGMLSENIFVSRVCTFDDPERFHSYRRDKTKQRNYTVAKLQ